MSQNHKELYQQIRTHTLEAWEVTDNSENDKVFIRMAFQCSEEDFVDWIENGEVPPVELSEEDMEKVSGGARHSLPKQLLPVINDGYTVR